MAMVRGDAGMTQSTHKRTNIVALLAILTLSSVTMVWLFWRFPVPTALVTVAVLAALGVSARLARSIDTEMPDLDSGEQRI
jgi:hypothetical protein